MIQSTLSPQPHPLFLHPTTSYASLTESLKDDSYKIISGECRNLMFGKFDLIMMCPVLSSPLRDMGMSPLHFLHYHQRPGPPGLLARPEADMKPCRFRQIEAAARQALLSFLSVFESCLSCPAPPRPFSASVRSSLQQEYTSASHIPALSFYMLVFSRQV